MRGALRRLYEDSKIPLRRLLFILILIFLVALTLPLVPNFQLTLHGTIIAATAITAAMTIYRMLPGLIKPSLDNARQIAGHEAAHAVVAHELGHEVIRISIVRSSRGRGGHTTYRSLLTTSRHEMIAISLAGFFYDTLQWGAEFKNDVLEDDYSLALRLALLPDENSEGDGSPSLALDRGAKLCKEMVEKNTQVIDKLSQELLRRWRPMGGDDFAKLMDEFQKIR